MPEEANQDAQETTEGGQAPELDPAQLERLSELVYRLMRDELMVNRERRGESPVRSWR